MFMYYHKIYQAKNKNKNNITSTNSDLNEPIIENEDLFSKDIKLFCKQFCKDLLPIIIPVGIFIGVVTIIVLIL